MEAKKVNILKTHKSSCEDVKIAIEGIWPDAFPKKKPFPKLMIDLSDNCIILFTEPGIGTIVQQGDCHYFFGDHSDYWDEDDFTDYDGEVTL